MKKTILFAALAALCSCMLSSCQSDPIYHKSYFYEVVVNVNYGVTAEVNKVGKELMDVVGDDGSNYRSTLSSPQDAQMKAGCEAIQKKYATNNSLTSKYFSFILRKITLDSDPDSKTPRLIEEIAEYGFGAALKEPYAFYNYESDIKDARSRLDAMESQMDKDTFKACYQTLIGVETAFKNKFSDIWYSPFCVRTSDDTAKGYGDSLYDEYSTKKNAVIYTYIIYRTDLLTGEKTTIWKKAFPINQ